MDDVFTNPAHPYTARPDELHPAGGGQGRPAAADRRPAAEPGARSRPAAPSTRAARAAGSAPTRRRVATAPSTCRRCAWSSPAARPPATTARRSSVSDPADIAGWRTSFPRPAGHGEPLLEIRGLKKYFPLTQGIVFKKTIGHVHAVDGVDLTLRRGETVGLVGESGCGKSTVAKLLVALEKPTGGTILYKGRDVAKMGGRALKQYRREVQIIFQDPYASLNPRMTVGDIVAEGWSVHADIAPAQGPAPAHPGTAGPRRPEPRLRQPLPAPVLRRPAPAHRHRPGARPAAGGHRLRRAGVGPGRVGAGSGGQPARGPAGRVRASPTCSSPTTCRWCGTSPTGSR